MPLKAETIDRLLLSKSFLDRIRFQPTAVHDRHTLAANIIAAHDAAELTIAAICDQLGCPSQQGKSYLMDYFEVLKKAQHPNQDVYARDYFRNLNDARNLLKHRGLFPDPTQWARVGEITFQHIAKWCSDYLNESLGDLDESALLIDPWVKQLYEDAKQLSARGEFKTALEELALALSKVFADNAALRGFEAGNAKPEDAIRLAGFGVHGNDFLAFQQFLPHVPTWGREPGTPVWQQSKYGHPGNWTLQNVEFCLRTLVDVAVKIQGAQWIPGPLERLVLYDQQIEAIKDGVEIWRMVAEKAADTFLGPLLQRYTKREVIRVLNRGETMRGVVSVSTERPVNPAVEALAGGDTKNCRVLDVLTPLLAGYFGQVLSAEVKVTCVPKDVDYVKQYYSWLPTFDWEPE